MTKRLHFVGIGGSGISGVAKLAEQFGYKVTGCDLEKSTAYGKNRVQGHNPSHIKNADLVITSPALFYADKDNTEIAAAKKDNKLVTWEEFLGKVLLKDKKLICIAGTHGKSTTTAMAGKLLIDNGFDPIVVLGANVPEWGGNSRFGLGEYAIVEADEFNDNFLNYHPEIAIINNIEFDHPDYFENEDQVLKSFDKFIKLLIGQKCLIYNYDSIGIQKLISKYGLNGINSKSYSLRRAKIDFSLKVLGIHNISNALGVIELGRILGIKDEIINKSLENFNGLERRMELIVDRGGIKVFDDYAHHPTAIKTTLEGIRSLFPKSKILVIDEPHGYKRTKALLKNYKGVFDSADKVIIGPIFKARDEFDISITPELVAKTSGHKNAIGLNSFDEIIKNLKFEISNFNYEVIVVMGAGKSYLWAREIASLIRVSFSDLTTFRIGGEIKKYYEAKNIDEIRTAVKFAKKNNLQIFIIGDGTDILVSDKTFSGVVIKYTANEILVSDDGTVESEGGANWDKLVEYSVKKNLQGIECLSGIPGTVGASPIQNIGAYGQEIKDTFVSLEAYDLEKYKFVTFSKEDLKFTYRDSIFRSPKYWQKYIITKVTLKLDKNAAPLLKYDSLSDYFKNKKIVSPTLQQVRDAVLKIRSGKFEDPKKVGNAGSFFKNPVVDRNKKEELEAKYPEIKTYPFENKYKIAAGWLIEKAGWKGKTYKSAGVSSMHALILLNNDGNAKAKDVYDLSEKIISGVNKKFGIKLEREVHLINF